MQKLQTEYHIKCTSEDIGRYVIVPGDPGRCEAIAKHFDEYHFVSQNREYCIYSGMLDGEKVSVCSTGIGGPSAAIAFEELIHCGADTFLRVGSCGGIAINVKSNDIVVATGAVRYEHTSREYAPIEYPAVPDFEMTGLVRDAAFEMGKQVHLGVVQCKDSFYGQHDPNSSPVGYELNAKWEAWKKLGVLASEMESAALFVVCAARGVRAASCFHVIWNQEREAAGLDQDMSTDMSVLAELAVRSMRKVIAADKLKNKVQL